MGQSETPRQNLFPVLKMSKQPRNQKNQIIRMKPDDRNPSIEKRVANSVTEASDHLINHNHEVIEIKTKLLHDLVNYIGKLVETNSRVLEFLGPNPFELPDRPSSMDVSEFQRPCNNLATHVQTLIGLVGGDPRSHGIASARWNEILELAQLLNTITMLGPVTFASKVQEIACNARTFSDTLLAVKPAPRDLKDALITEISAIVRLSSLYLLTHSIHDLRDMNSRLLVQAQVHARQDIATVDLRDIVADAADEHRPLAIKKGIDLRYSPDPRDSVRVHVDTVGLRESVNHILGNAVKYTGELPSDSTYDNTWINVKVFKSSGCARLSVESWGVPITIDEHRERKYFGTNSRGFFATAFDIKGTGRGLHFVHAFAQRCGGSIEVETSPVPRPSVGVVNRSSIDSTKTTVILSLPLYTR